MSASGLARHVDGKWGAPVEVANGVQADGTRHPCWNPVLFETAPGTLTLFYKVGPSPQRWWGMTRTSARQRQDVERSDPAARRHSRPDQEQAGAARRRDAPQPDEHRVDGAAEQVARALRAQQRCRQERGRSFVPAAGPDIDAIQPSILVHPKGRLQAVGRSRSGRVFETWSDDGGKSWSAVTLLALPNPSAGTDAVTLADGRQLIVYNHTPKGRTPLNVALSSDGKLWAAALVLESEPGEYSYPAVIQAPDGLVHVTYTWKRQRIRHVVIDPKRLQAVPMPDGEWPASSK